MSTDVVIIGLGYVGLPLAREACRSGLSVLGFDVKAAVVDELNAGSSHIDDVSSEDVQAMREAGFRATTDPTVAKELGITDEQKQKLEEARREIGESMRDSFRELRDLSGEERDKKAEELRAEANKKLLAVLNPDQQAKLESLKGEPVDIDMSQFRGRDSGGRGGEGRRDGRGERGRDRESSDADDQSKSE